MSYLDIIHALPGWTAHNMPKFADGIHQAIHGLSGEMLTVEYGEREFAAVHTIRSQWEEWLSGAFSLQFRCTGESGLVLRASGIAPLILLSPCGDGSGIADTVSVKDTLHCYLCGCLTLLLTGSILAHKTLKPLSNTAWNSLGSIVEPLDRLWKEAEPLRGALCRMEALEIIADGCDQGAACMIAELLGEEGLLAGVVDSENWGHVNFYAQHRGETGVLLLCQGGRANRSYLETAAGMAVAINRPVLWIGDSAPRCKGEIASLILAPFPEHYPAVGSMGMVLASTLLLNTSGGNS